jgi:hypothetical protein
MEIAVAEDRVLVFQDQLDEEEAENLARKNKADAFGALQKLTGFLNRPKEEDFELTYKEHRYEPFWHIVGTAHYVYDRTAKHHWPTTGPEVQSFTLEGKDYTVNNGTVSISVLEHCQQEETQELLVDGVTVAKNVSLKEYLKFSAKEANKSDIEKLAEKNAVVPPVARASALVRETASKMIPSIQADKIFEESVEFQNVDLYYRPVYAFKFKWLSKNKEAVIEVDGLTGKIAFSQKSFPQLVGKVLDYDFLFDVGGDAVGMFVPGGSIAVKMAKKYIDVKHRNK